jgi:SPP1 family predicted phage head-tail adaptor
MPIKCCDITAGDLNKQVIIETKSASRKAGGGNTVTWATVCAVWAKITPRPTNEFLRALGKDPQTSHKIFMRYRDDITPRERIKYGSRYFGIRSVINVEEKGKWLEIDALESPEAEA